MGAGARWAGGPSGYPSFWQVYKFTLPVFKRHPRKAHAHACSDQAFLDLNCHHRYLPQRSVQVATRNDGAFPSSPVYQLPPGLPTLASSWCWLWWGPQKPGWWDFSARTMRAPPRASHFTESPSRVNKPSPLHTRTCMRVQAPTPMQVHRSVHKASHTAPSPQSHPSETGLCTHWEVRDQVPTMMTSGPTDTTRGHRGQAPYTIEVKKPFYDHKPKYKRKEF